MSGLQNRLTAANYRRRGGAALTGIVGGLFER